MFNKFDALIILAVFIPFLLANFLWFTGDRELALFVSIWVPSNIGIGIYLKLIRLRYFLFKNLYKEYQGKK